MRDFLARMAGYVELQQSALPALDEEPRIRPMQGTVIDDVIPEDIIDDLPLLRYESDSESSDGDALEPMKHLTTYWKPRNGRISILPPMYARAITESTGSSLFAEEAEKRYRIFQGDFQLALEKLLRLEPLLVRSSVSFLGTVADLSTHSRKHSKRNQEIPPTEQLAISLSGLPINKTRSWSTSMWAVVILPIIVSS